MPLEVNFNLNLIIKFRVIKCSRDVARIEAYVYLVVELKVQLALCVT